MTDFVLVGAGLLALFLGGESLIRGALSLAHRFRVSPLLAGLVIVGFGTSLPELVVSVDAALQGQPAIAIGNIVGSNITNILLILGLSALISPMCVEPRSLNRDGLTMLAASGLFILLAWSGTIARFEGLLCFTALAAYLTWAYLGERVQGDAGGAMHAAEADEVQVLPQTLWSGVIATFVGFIVLVAGSHLLLTGATAIARSHGLTESVIGLTLVAVGTSLPELAVSLVAAIRRHADVAIGNILGSNIFNTLCILGITGMVTPLPVEARILHFDQWVMLGASVALVLFMRVGMRLSRVEAAFLLVGYVAWFVATFTLMT